MGKWIGNTKISFSGIVRALKTPDLESVDPAVLELQKGCGLLRRPSARFVNVRGQMGRVCLDSGDLSVLMEATQPPEEP